MRLPSIHSSISIRSVMCKTPTRVGTRIRTPSPRRCSVKKEMAAASLIHSEWEERSESRAQTKSSGASISNVTATDPTDSQSYDAPPPRLDVPAPEGAESGFHLGFRQVPVGGIS